MFHHNIPQDEGTPILETLASDVDDFLKRAKRCIQMSTRSHMATNRLPYNQLARANIMLMIDEDLSQAIVEAAADGNNRRNYRGGDRGERIVPPGRNADEDLRDYVAPNLKRFPIVLPSEVHYSWASARDHIRRIYQNRMQDVFPAGPDGIVHQLRVSEDAIWSQIEVISYLNDMVNHDPYLSI